MTLARMARTLFTIVDTSGLLRASGRVLKNYKIEAIRPDVIFALERRNELAPIRMANKHVPAIRLKPSRAAHAKWDYETIEVRARSYARHFVDALRVELALDTLIFQRTLLFSGRPVTQEGAIGKNAIVLITPVKTEQVRIIQFGDQYLKPDDSGVGQVKWAW